MKLRPYVENEVFHDFAADEWNQNRVGGGVSSQPASWLAIDIYYLYVATKKAGDWSNSNVLGLNANVKF